MKSCAFLAIPFQYQHFQLNTLFDNMHCDKVVESDCRPELAQWLEKGLVIRMSGGSTPTGATDYLNVNCC